MWGSVSNPLAFSTGPAGTPDGLQPVHHLVLAQRGCPPGHDVVQLPLMPQPRLGAGEPGFRCQGRLLHDPAQRLPVGFVAYGDDGPLVLAAAWVATMGGHAFVTVPYPACPASVVGVVQDALSEEGHAHLVHCQVDPHPPAGPRPVHQRGQNRKFRGQAGQKVGVGVAHLVGHVRRCGPAAGFPRGDGAWGERRGEGGPYSRAGSGGTGLRPDREIPGERAGAVGRLQG